MRSPILQLVTDYRYALRPCKSLLTALNLQILQKGAITIMVYIISKDGQPLMPTKRSGKVYRLLKTKQAKVVRRCPFTIKLLYEPETLIVQKLSQDKILVQSILVQPVLGTTKFCINHRLN